MEWKKSSHSACNGDCLEAQGGVLVRDSKLGEESPVLAFSPAAWTGFLETVKSS